MRYVLWALCLLCTGLRMAYALEPVQAPFILAVHPYLPSEEIQKRFTPLAQYLSRQLDRPVQIRVGRDYAQHVEAIGLNHVDMAFMGPSSYVLLEGRYGVKPLLARIAIKGKSSLSGYIVTTAHSAVRNLNDLRGKRFAFVDPDSTMGTVVPRYVMQEAGIELRALGAYQFLGGHKNVALAVLSGDYDAGAIKTEVYDEMATRGLRILSTLPEVSEHLFVVRSDMPVKQVKQLRQILLKLQDQVEGAAIMRAINKDMTALVAVANTDYDNLRKMQRAVESKRN